MKRLYHKKSAKANSTKPNHRDVLLFKISEEPNGLRSSHLSWITDLWSGKDGYQVAFPAPKAEGKDHKDQGLFVPIKQLTCQVLHDAETELRSGEGLVTELEEFRFRCNVVLGPNIIEKSDICALNVIVLITDLYNTTSV
ncbi:hypothetical protein TURU_150470 [Turdus rufiventris]|nr:hypothetical protein TURU_150470 [Turdus rufiventris]